MKEQRENLLSKKIKNMSSNIGNKIQENRKQKNKTLDWLAEQTGFTKGYLSKIENVEFISSPLNESFSVTRTSDYGYEKTISLLKNNKFVKSLGVENLIINYNLSPADIIEIYNFDKNSNDLLIKERLYLSRASKNIYIGLNERKKSILHVYFENICLSFALFPLSFCRCCLTLSLCRSLSVSARPIFR